MPETIECKCGNNTFYFIPTGMIMCTKCLATIPFSNMKKIVDEWHRYQKTAAQEEQGIKGV